MAAKPSVQQLLERMLESGATVEHVCADWPELIVAVRAGWQRVLAVARHVDVLFPGDACTSVFAAAADAGGPAFWERERCGALWQRVDAALRRADRGN